MDELSVKINKSKTVTASRSDVRVEFAKRLFYQHIEISGMSWGVLENARRTLAGLADMYLLQPKRN